MRFMLNVMIPTEAPQGEWEPSADMVADNGLYFYDRETWELLKFVQVPWPGVNHLDFSADGSYLMVTTESAGVVVKIDVAAMEIIGTVEVGGSPLDIRLGPDLILADQQCVLFVFR